MIMSTKTKTVAALLSMYVARGAAKEIEELKLNRIRPHNRDASPASKAGKKVCLEYGFLNDVVAKGSATAIGSFGPNGLGLLGACAGQVPVPGEVCCKKLAAAYNHPNYVPPYDFDDAYECLSNPANGPFLVGNWWLQRDVNYGRIFFEKGKVCGKITVGTDDDLTDPVNDSKTTLELWDDKYIDKPLRLFKEFKVDYDFRVVKGGSGGYLNFYVRTEAGRNTYYDCNLVYLIPNKKGSGTLVITPETEIDSTRQRTGTNPGNNNGCPGQSSSEKTTIKKYLTANPNAVMGVGNGEKYAFVLTTGSTDENNYGQEICWSNVSIKRNDDAGSIFVDAYEFTTL